MEANLHCCKHEGQRIALAQCLLDIVVLREIGEQEHTSRGQARMIHVLLQYQENVMSPRFAIMCQGSRRKIGLVFAVMP